MSCMTLHPSCIAANCPRAMVLRDECGVCLDPAYQWRDGKVCWVLINLRLAGKSDAEIEREMKRYAEWRG